MGEFKRKAGGRRVFTTEFKRATVERIRSGETTLAQLSRALEIAPGILALRLARTPALPHPIASAKRCILRAQAPANADPGLGPYAFDRPLPCV